MVIEIAAQAVADATVVNDLEAISRMLIELWRRAGAIMACCG